MLPEILALVVGYAFFDIHREIRLLLSLNGSLKLVKEIKGITLFTLVDVAEKMRKTTKKRKMLEQYIAYYKRVINGTQAKWLANKRNKREKKQIIDDLRKKLQPFDELVDYLSGRGFFKSRIALRQRMMCWKKSINASTLLL